MAVCVAVIGKDNGPLFFKCRGRREDGLSGPLTLSPVVVEGEDLQLQYSFIVSSALDIVEERVQAGPHHLYKGTALASATGGEGGPPVQSRELYLGALTSQEDYKVYGYMTNTKIKFIIIVEEASVPLRENDIRMMFRKVHGAFCDLMGDPFYVPGTEIRSKRFDAVMSSILAGQG